MPDPVIAASTSASADAAAYTVVARRYRPRTFEQLVGQDHIGQALAKAIATGRVGHAYLFTGARGVGKTSSARIFAKMLNAPETKIGETNDDSQAIDTGDDMDVIEIDAASNRGIDEIRELRANVGKRPSHSRYKIYIIDEVHMLTTQAFNALLKTLEEPPPHVKFIFCTTDPEKVPITVLSRCQRFDFAPVRPDAIRQRLAEICIAEGFEADDDALALLARRAAGSMRDSQSLLEQVMSFSSGRITSQQVHELLGTADESRLHELAEALAGRDGVAALTLLDRAIKEGTDAGQYAEQMLGYLRDLMAIAVGGGPDLLKVCNPSNFEQVKRLATNWGLQTILAAVQMLDEALVRMRFSVQSQALFEVALIQITQLQDLATIAKIIESVQQGVASPSPRRIANAVVPVSATPPRAPAPSAPPSSTAEKKNVKALTGQSLATSVEHLPDTTSTVEPTLNASDFPLSNVSDLTASDSTAPDFETPDAEISDAEISDLAISNLTSSDFTASDSATAQPRATAHGLRESVVAPQTRVPSTIAIHAPARSAAGSSSGEGATGTLHPSAHSAEGRQALETWKSAAATIDGMLGDFAATAVAVECKAAGQWTVVFPPGSAKPVEYCEAPTRRAELQVAVDAAAAAAMEFSFRVQPGVAVRSTAETPVSTAVARSQRMRQIGEHPLVNKLCELLQGEVVRIDPARSALSSETQTAVSRETRTPASAH